MDMLTQGVIAAATIMWLLSYFNFRRILGYAAFVDIVVTGGFMWMFAGSYAGMMTGLIAGLMVSISLRAGRKLFGIEKLALRRAKGRVLPSFVWKKEQI